MSRLKNPSFAVSVPVHNAQELAWLEDLLQKNQVGYFGEEQVHNPGKWICEECGNEARDHDKDGNCP